ncbi:thermostable hemolysin [Phenylobacterium aquaticum]|uniref:thermostable hemolysin n=1 Tax=Phenylobacterium aquaticum TaxID=1763816 RepID=UPI0026EE933C|nr:thermostable hemolysin [Phenylobacterium aquaticum]
MMMVDDGALLGHLRFDADRVRRFTRLQPGVISIHHLLQPERQRVEAYLEAAYAKAFDGQIRRHYPTLMSVQDRQGNIHAAVGFRLAARAPLFLEQYLDAPVEVALEARFGAPLRRAQVAEIGNLASDSPGASLFLFLALARHLDRQGCTHAVATATRQLRRGFARVGFATEHLTRAAPDRLPDQGADWGAYYSRDPQVLAGAIAPALPALAQMLLADPIVECGILPRLHPDLRAGAAL